MSSAVVLATAGYDHKIRFWEAPTGVCARSIRYPDSQVNCLQITPDKQFLAAGGNPHVRLFEVGGNANPNPVVSYEGHVGNVMAVGFQQDGKWLYTASEDGTVKLWDTRASGCQRTLENSTATSSSSSGGGGGAGGASGSGHHHTSMVAVNSVVLHPNQAELVTGDQEGRVRVWDLGSNRCVHETLPEGSVPVRSVSVANDASLIAAGNNQANLYVWHYQEGSPDAYFSRPAHVQPVKTHARFLLKCAFSPDSQRLVTTSADKTAKLWNVRKWEVEHTLKDHQRWVWDAAFSADSSYLVTACSDHHPRLWDLRTGDLVRTYQGSNLAVTCVALNDAQI
ncbi:WD40 repeat containing protein [Nannochloropsis gaditana]|uniref:WD40 repeat containing protein n=2 Tax=Nannochloropsis gaditana TaxID=72520 RepID=W7TXG6_9STRA|nr:WD40 repeat containing protein [Nannochloropsis gaditana]